MAKIKHIALATQDPDATAKFYVDVFGLKQVGRIDNPNTSGYYLSDGDINLAILKFKNDKVAGVERGKEWSGIHHFGFQVDDLEDTTERLVGANAPRRDDINEALAHFEAALRIRPDYVEARRNLKLTLARAINPVGYLDAQRASRERLTRGEPR